MTEDVLLGVDALPLDERERDEELRAYFCERVVECERVREGWAVRLTVPDDPAMYVDPRLEEGLRWWGLEELTSLPFVRRQLPTHQLALNDTWCLLPWSRWLAGLGREGRPEEIVLLHVDDHDDLMSPRLLVEPDGYVDAITGAPFDVFAPETVEAAITSGAVGMGSFLAPLLSAVPVVHVRHLCATKYATSRPGLWSLHAGTTADTLLAPGRPRLEIARKREDGTPRGSTYRVDADPNTWLDGLPACPTLLHIDMDYFNNRFNGDSDWEERADRHDPPLEDVMNAARQMFGALNRSVVGGLADVTVAISPGFFPAELWDPVTSLVAEELGSSRLVARP